MKNNSTNKKILYAGLAVLFVIFIAGIIWTNNKPKAEEYIFPSPENVVNQYFTSWSNKDYVNIYSTFSDGFKKIESTARTLEDFKNYVDSQEIQSVEIKNIKELSNDRQTASVNYDVEFTLSNRQKTSYQGTFALKYRQGDIIQGWKLIHPYGENIDIL